jgi:hypothetical protein
MLSKPTKTRSLGNEVAAARLGDEGPMEENDRLSRELATRRVRRFSPELLHYRKMVEIESEALYRGLQRSGGLSEA